MLRNIEIAPLRAGHETAEQDGEGALSSSQVIKQSTVARRFEAGDVLTRAQDLASDLIARAEQDAEKRRALGFHRGLQQGIGAALSPIAAMISQWERVRATLREDAEKALRTCLRDLAKREPLLTTLIEMTLQAHVARPPTCVTIRVPPGADRNALQDRCVALGLTSNIEFGDSQDIFSIGWDGHVWTAHLGEIADIAMAEHVRAVDDAALSSVQASEICRQSLMDAMKGWPSEREGGQEPG